MEERTKIINNVSRDSVPNLLSGDDLIEFSEAKMEFEKENDVSDKKVKKNAEPEAIMKID